MSTQEELAAEVLMLRQKLSEANAEVESLRQQKSTGPQLSFIPEVRPSIAYRPITSDLVVEALEVIKREQAPLYKALDGMLAETMSLALVIGGCSHCIALQGLAIFYSRLRSQVETNALEELSKL